MNKRDTVDALKRLSAEYMDLTGNQLFQYTSKPATVTRYVFSDRTVNSGGEALSYAGAMVTLAQKEPAAEIVKASGTGNASTRIRQHDTYKFSAAIVLDGNVVEAMTCIKQADAELWAHNRLKEYA